MSVYIESCFLIVVDLAVVVVLVLGVVVVNWDLKKSLKLQIICSKFKSKDNKCFGAWGQNIGKVFRIRGTVSLILNDPTRKDSNDHLQLYPDLYLYCCGRKRRFFWFEKYFKSKNWSGHFRREPTKEKKTFLINQNMDV